MAKFNIKIDKDKCKGCKLCVIFCPKGAIKQSKHINKMGVYFVEFIDKDLCAGCANCAIMCPECAIEIFKEEK